VESSGGALASAATAAEGSLTVPPTPGGRVGVGGGGVGGTGVFVGVDVLVGVGVKVAVGGAGV